MPDQPKLNLNDIFGTTAESPEPPHPRLRDWKRRLAAPGTTASLEVFRPTGEFGQVRPEMYVQFTEGGHETHLDTVPWDDDLNADLIKLGVKSVGSQQESERFALGLRAAMRKIAREFGDGYFNAVLVELIKDSDFTGHKEIAEVMRYAYANSPYREGSRFDRYTTCRALITDAISGRAKELTRDLAYDREEAKQILVSALARYLDERFSVSTRREFGML